MIKLTKHLKQGKFELKNDILLNGNNNFVVELLPFLDSRDEWDNLIGLIYLNFLMIPWNKLNQKMWNDRLY